MRIADLPKNVKQLYPFEGEESCYFEVKGGHKIHYLDVGEGLPVVMIHGHPTWSFYYRDMIKGLSSRFRCIAVDHLGCGLSEKPQDYSYVLENHIANLIELVEGLGLKKFNLVVHDWGGTIGMGLAEHFVDRVERVVILNTSAFRSKHIPLRIRVCRVPVIGKALIRGINLFVRAANYMGSVNRLPFVVKEAYCLPFSDWANRVASYEFVRDIPMSEKHRSYGKLVEVEENLDKLLGKKMMICWGGQDFCFNDYFFNEWRERFPNAQAHYFEDAGHYVLEDVGESILPLTRCFFESTITKT